MKTMKIIKLTSDSRIYKLACKHHRNKTLCPYCPEHGGENYWNWEYSYKLYVHTTWKKHRRHQYKIKRAS